MKLARFRFTPTDLADVITNPRGSAKAYAAAGTAFVVAWFSDQGIALPDSVNTGINDIATYVIGSLLVGALAWLTRNGSATKIRFEQESLDPARDEL